jgi:hypothetical protein
MNTKQSLRRGLALATVIGAVAAPAASAYPVDKPLPGTHGDEPNNAIVHREGGKAGPETSTASGDGFDWGDAGIGAAATLALTAIGLGGAITVGTRRHREGQPASTA